MTDSKTDRLMDKPTDRQTNRQTDTRGNNLPPDTDRENIIENQ